MRTNLFAMQHEDTVIHNLSGVTKFVCFLLLTFTVMFSYDIRVILAMMLFSFTVFRVSKIKFSQIKLMIAYIGVFLITNAILTFFFSPAYGEEVYGTSHELFTIFGPYIVTSETLFFILTKFLKYASVIPFGIMFVLTTDPSEFASSISSIGVHYKAAYSVALTLRYFPDVQREYREISQAQQARGLEMSKKAKLWKRFTRSIAIVLPLIMSTLDKIDTITNAMDLRGFGKNKKRTWYAKRKLTKSDYTAITISIIIFLGSLAVSVFINHSRFFNPFI